MDVLLITSVNISTESENRKGKEVVDLSRKENQDKRSKFLGDF